MMNGAVVGSMRFYGADYGLNYGVSIPTIRSVAQGVCADVDERDTNHRFACQLLLQEIRELRLAAFWFADPLVADLLDRVARSIINSEVAEEAAFVLLYRVEGVERWLSEEGDNSELLSYCALLSLAKRYESVCDEISIATLSCDILSLLNSEPKLLPKGVVALLDSLLKVGTHLDQIEAFLEQLPPDNHASTYIRDEMSWRLELAAEL